LKNFYRTASWEDDLIKQFEKKIAVQNGNYHILMLVLAAGSDLENAPEPFREGITEHFLNWRHILEYISMMVSRYGLLKAPKACPEKALKDTLLDYNNATLEERDLFEENFQSRTVNHKTSRQEMGNSRTKNRLKEYPSLLSRISTNINPEGKYDTHKGVEYRQINNYKNDNFVEYQLFDSDESYINGKNIPSKGDVEIRKKLPNFMSKVPLPGKK
jgi:hypothetical protein